MVFLLRSSGGATFRIPSVGPSPGFLFPSFITRFPCTPGEYKACEFLSSKKWADLLFPAFRPLSSIREGFFLPSASLTWTPIFFSDVFTVVLFFYSTARLTILFSSMVSSPPHIEEW